MRLIVVIVAITLAFLHSCSGVYVTLTEQSKAKSFIEHATRTILQKQEIINYFIWNFESNSQLSAQQQELLIDAEETIRSTLKEIYHKYHGLSFYEPAFGRQIHSLISAPQKALFLNDTDYKKFVDASNLVLLDLKHQMVALPVDPKCLTIDCTKVKLNSVERNEKILKMENATDLKHYWEIFYSNRKFLQQDFDDFIKIFIEGASQVSLGKPLTIWYSEYLDANPSQKDATDLIAEMSNVFYQLEPLYKELHGFIRATWIRKHPDANIGVRDKIPEHLVEQLLLQISNDEILFELPDPQTGYPGITEKLKSNKYKTHDILKVTNDFYNTLRMEDVYEEFWNSGTRKSMKPLDECSNTLLKAQDYISLKYCDNPTFRGYFDSFKTAAQIRYSVLSKNQKLGLDRETCPGFGDGIGLAAGLSGTSQFYIEKLGLDSHVDYVNKRPNQLYVLALQLIKLHRYFVYERLWTDILSGHIRDTDEINCHYWRLQGEIAGVKPPLMRSHNFWDVPEEFLDRIPPKGQNTKDIVSFIVGFQIYKSFCRLSNLDVSHEGHNTLNSCDFSGKDGLGKMLSKVMGFGFEKHWRQELKALTDERQLNGLAIADYFEPLKLHLQRLNLEQRVPVGWEARTDCSQYSLTTNPQ